jgi:hypothetical protein
MNLIYRGQAYTASNMAAPVNPHAYLTYRGQSYQPSLACAVIPKEKLTYRGVPYVQPKSTTIKGFTPAIA